MNFLWSKTGFCLIVLRKFTDSNISYDSNKAAIKLHILTNLEAY